MILKFGMQRRVLEYYQICSNDDLGLTLTYFTVRSHLVHFAFVWEKSKTMDFSETIVVYDLKQATDDRSDKKFLLTSKLCPVGAVCSLLRGYIHILNHWKKKESIKSDFKDIFWNLQQMNEVTRHFCWHQNFIPCGLYFSPGAIYRYKIMKKCIKSDFKEICLKLATNDRRDKMFLLTSKFRPKEVVPCPGAIYMYKNHEKMCIKSEVDEILFKIATNDIVMRPSCWHQNFGPDGVSALPKGYVKSWKKKCA